LGFGQLKSETFDLWPEANYRPPAFVKNDLKISDLHAYWHITDTPENICIPGIIILFIHYFCI